TIDVAYRYFATPRRTFIMADTPGHVRYTRNMVTGASTADLALVIVDARNGIVQQSRRHAFIASLLRIPHIVVCVNKMDLVDWSEDVYNRIADEFTDFAARLEVSDVSFIPTSALKGDNVVERSENMPWYGGSPLLYHLEHVHIASDRNLIDVRFPVQWVVRPGTDEHHDYRGYAGQVASGVLRAGDDVVVLPSGASSRIARIDTFDGPVDEAYPPMSVTVHLADDLDISRGDMICRPHNQPAVSRDVDAIVCWMSETPVRAGARWAPAARRSGSPGCPPRASRRSRPLWRSAWWSTGARRTGSTATTCATGSTRTSASPPRTARRTCAAPPMPRGCWPTPGRSRSSRSCRPTRPTASARARPTRPRAWS